MKHFNNLVRTKKKSLTIKMKDKNKNNKSEILQEFFLNALTLAVLNQSWLEVVSDEKMRDSELG